MDDVGRVNVVKRVHVFASQNSIRRWFTVVELNYPVVDLESLVFAFAYCLVVSAVPNAMSRDNLQFRESISGFYLYPKNVPVAV